MAFLLHSFDREMCLSTSAQISEAHTILASGVCRARTFAFEPDPDTFTALSRNVALNGIQLLVKSHECALGAKQGRVELTVGLDTMNRVTADTTVRTRAISLDTLDRALNGARPNLIKLDVEGFKSEVCGWCGANSQ